MSQLQSDLEVDERSFGLHVKAPGEKRHCATVIVFDHEIGSDRGRETRRLFV